MSIDIDDNDFDDIKENDILTIQLKYKSSKIEHNKSFRLNKDIINIIENDLKHKEELLCDYIKTRLCTKCKNCPAVMYKDIKLKKIDNELYFILNKEV